MIVNVEDYTRYAIVIVLVVGNHRVCSISQ